MNDSSMQQMARNYLTFCKDPSCTTPCGTTATTTMVYTTKENGFCQQKCLYAVKTNAKYRAKQTSVLSIKGYK